jgi:hypothetical protein
MRNANDGPLDHLLFDCCRELFSSYELDVHPRDRSEFPATEQLAVCGVMGFGGKSMRGALVLATTKEPLVHTNPDAAGSQRDWVCELANQLLGRVKNRLLARGVELWLATPAGLSGENLSPTASKLRAPQVFAAANGFVCVWIDCEYAPGFTLPSSPLLDVELPVQEGETILF